jgi:transposase
MPSIEYKMTEVYCFVSDVLAARPDLANWRRSPNAHPAFTDAEVITIAVVQSCYQVPTLKRTYELVADNHAAAFPHLCSYKQFIARLNRLGEIIGHLVSLCCIAGWLRLYLLDSKPLPVCKQVRTGRVRLLREEGAYWGKSSAGWYFGFKLHAIVDRRGQIWWAILTPGNVQDRDVAALLASALDGGLGLGDHGYRSQTHQEEVAEATDLLLLTPKDAGAAKTLVSTLRQRVETVFSQLWHQFIDRIYSRSWTGLWTAARLKMLFHNMATNGYVTI